MDFDVQVVSHKASFSMVVISQTFTETCAWNLYVFQVGLDLEVVCSTCLIPGRRSICHDTDGRHPGFKMF